VPQDDLADRLHSAAVHLLRRVATVDPRSGLSPARLSALSVIVFGGPLTMTQLARAERVSPATISSTVNGLESAGLVSRSRTGPDARSVTVEATVAGREVLAEGRRRRVAVLAEDLGRLSAQDRQALATGLYALEKLLATERAGQP
jgi:DNA-binding MarR family transcriptional regulator